MMDFATICHDFDLGHVMAFAQTSGGLLHELWELKTSVGKFAVKKLNLQNLRLLHHNLVDPAQSQAIALNMQQCGIATAVALKSTQHQYVEIIAGQSIMVFSWVEGQCLFYENITLNMAREIGAVLAHLHKANLQLSGLNQPNWFGFPKQHWLGRINSLSPEKKAFMNAGLSDILRWNDLALLAPTQCSQNLIVSHRDFDPKNVLWNEQSSPILIDWEYAGLIDPMLELFIVSLNWSFTSTGQIDHDKFQTIWTCYEDTMGPHLRLNQSVLNGYFGYCLDWLEFNMKRHAMANCAISWQEVLNTLAAMRLVEESFFKLYGERKK
jgi:thiamine kinase-like enzyme